MQNVHKIKCFSRESLRKVRIYLISLLDFTTLPRSGIERLHRELKKVAYLGVWCDHAGASPRGDRYDSKCLVNNVIDIFIIMLQVGFGVKKLPTLVLGCIWGLFVNKNSPENIQRHITNTDKIQQNAQSFYITHTLIYSFIHSFIHSFIRSFIHSFTSLMHHPFITHCIILCITHSSHCIPTHHTMHHPFITLHVNTSYQ